MKAEEQSAVSGQRSASRECLLRVESIPFVLFVPSCGKKCFLFLLFLYWLALPVAAHIGSPNVIFEGKAGPHPVRVVVRPPEVVPGLAEISVRALAPGVTRVSVLPAHWTAGKRGAPPPDIAQPVRGEPNLYTATLWLMTPGAYTVHVSVEGAGGAGEVVVPVNNFALVRKQMTPAFAVVLVGLGLFLFLTAVKLIGAAWGEAVLRPEEAIARPVRMRATWAMVASGLLFSSMVVGGKVWWDSVDGHYRNNRLYRPLPATTEVFTTNAQPVLRLRVDTRGNGQRYWTPLTPDHGKLMHLFLIRDEEPDTFAHLHPMQRDATTFETTLPPLPPGRYSVIAEVAHETGFTQTLTAKADLPEPPENAANYTRRAGSNDPLCGVPLRRAPGDTSTTAFDPDDSWHFGDPLPASTPNSCRLPGGYVMEWERTSALQTQREASLRFKLFKPDGSPAPLETYIGMPGHAAVRRADGGVFAHLHPAGTISMGAQEAFARREASREKQPSLPAATAIHATSLTNVVSFPYEFPSAGRYRLWVQMKSEGRVLTGVFDAEVAEAR
ncbi:MAG: hypothetical protein RL514_2313 [Verrucomicrobiota bacterium]|jgi:hypothetical protein